MAVCLISDNSEGEDNMLLKKIDVILTMRYLNDRKFIGEINYLQKFVL